MHFATFSLNTQKYGFLLGKGANITTHLQKTFPTLNRIIKEGILITNIKKGPENNFRALFGENSRKLLIRNVFCGGGGIRTPGAFQLNSFQDCRHRPLGHTSKADAKVVKNYSFAKNFQWKRIR